MAFPTIALSPEARDDLRRIRASYTQQGAGPRAKRRLLHILDAIADIAEAPDRWPLDADCPGTRCRVIGRHVVRYSLPNDAAGRPLVYVQRIFGPGRQRVP